MRLLILLLMSIGLYNNLSAAALHGKVSLKRKGNYPKENPYTNNIFRTDLRFTQWHLNRKFESVNLRDYNDSTDVVVYLSHVPEQYRTKEIPAQEPVKVYIEGARFKPRVMPIMTGGTIEFVNIDPVPHDIYSFSIPKTFQTPFFQNEHAFVTFKESGGVILHSSVYTDMKAHVLILEHPYFTKTRDNGTYSMRNIRPGIYQVTAWHPDLPPVTKEVEINYGETIKVDFNLSTLGLPQALTK